MQKINAKSTHSYDKSPRLFRRRLLTSAICLAGLASAASATQVTTLLDLENVPGQAYTFYTYTFQAQLAQTYITFEFRQDPAYWRLDDVSFTLASAPGSELLINGGFEGGSYGGQNTPNSWTLIGQAGLSAGGTVDTGCARTGAYCYNDGAVGGVDGLYQAIATTVGQSYTLSFWLAADGGSPASAIVQVGASLDNGGTLVPVPPTPTTTDIIGPHTTTEYAGGSLNPVFDGGTLQFDTSTTLSDNFSITTNNATVDNSGKTAVMSGVLSDASGAGSLSVTNSSSGGSLVLTGNNTYTGGTTINSGATLSLGNGGTTGSIAGNVVDNGSLIFNHSNNLIFGGNISGSGSVTQAGTGILTLSGTNTYSGATSVSSGTLRTGATNTLSNTSNISIASGATLDLNNFSQSINALSGAGNVTLGSGTLTTNSSGNSTFSGVISGNGGLTQNGTGILTLSGINTYTGATTISNGTIRAGATNTLANSSNISLASGATLDLNNFSQSIASLSGAGNISLGSARLTTNSNSNTSFSGVITGSGGLTQLGSGTLTVTGNNTFTGSTIIDNGRITLGSGGMLAGDVVNNSELQFNRNDNITFNHVISGSGRVIQSGSGTLILSGTNNYSGGTRIENGIVQISNDAALGNVSGTVTLNQGALKISADTTMTRNIVLEAGSNTIDTASGTTVLGLGTFSGSGALVKAGSGLLVLTAINSYSGGTTIDAGILRIDSGAQLGSGPVTLNGGILQTSTNVGTDQTVVLASDTVINTDAGTTALLTGNVVSSGSGGCFEKTGAGTLNLAGTATLNNGTCVEQGILRANGTLISNVSVEDGAALRGSGHIAGNVITNGTLAPGNSPGTLTVNGNVTMTSSSTLQIDIDGLGTGTGAGNYSRVLVTGTNNQFIAGGTLSPLLRGITGNASNNFTPALGDQFRIVTAEGGVIGHFNTLQQPAAGLAPNTRFSVFYNMNNSNSIDLLVTPTSYADYVQGNHNTRAAAGVVDNINATNDSGTASAKQTDLLYQLAALNASQLSSTMTSLAGEVHGAMAASAVQTTRKLQSAVERQLGTTPDENAGDFLWIDTSTTHGDTSGDHHASSFDNDRSQFVIGADLWRSERNRFGVGVSNSENDVSAHEGSGTIRATSLFAYGDQHVGRTLIDGTAAYGNSRWNTDRSDVLDNVGALKTHADGHDALISVRASLPTQIRSMIVTPFVRAGWRRVERDSADEGSATPSALTLKNYSADGTRFVAGIAGGSQQNDPLAQLLTYRYSVGLGTDTGAIDRAEVDAKLVDQAFIIEAPHADRNFAQANIGATVRFAKNAYGYIGVDGEARDGSHELGANAGLNVRF